MITRALLTRVRWPTDVLTDLAASRLPEYNVSNTVSDSLCSIHIRKFYTRKHQEISEFDLLRIQKRLSEDIAVKKLHLERRIREPQEAEATISWRSQ